MTDSATPPVKYAAFNARIIASSLDLGLLLLLLEPLMDIVLNNLFPPVNRQHIMDVISSPTRTTADLWNLFLHESVAQRFIVSNLLEVAFICMYVLPFWFYYSATPGKMITRIEIRDATTGERMTRRQSVIRFLGYMVSAIPLTLGFLWVLTNRKRRGWHDYMANTVVVTKTRSNKDGSLAAFVSSARPSVNR